MSVTFSRVSDSILFPMPADKSALGNIPVQAFQYCEAMRVASSWGWYVFPPATMSLMFDGYETFLADEGQWRTFTHEPMPDPVMAQWDSTCPDLLKGFAPRLLTALSEPGTVQIWSGLFVETAPGWSVLIRPPVNFNNKSAYYCYEAIVETDAFKPMPLFINIKLTRTNSEILIRREEPLFQVMAIQKTSYTSAQAVMQDITTGTDTPQPAFDWGGLNDTLRIPGVTKPRASAGSYGAKIRKNARTTGQD
jgi:Family of unknown function (DUF6065)